MKELEDMPAGIKVSYLKGYLEPVYYCSCGKYQTFIEPDLVQSIGWEFINNEWKCPTCAPNSIHLY